MMEMDLQKKSRGRQKIEMKLIECENSRAVTFSKRKRTLFAKAKRFSSLTGSTIAIFFTSSKGFMHASGSICLHSIVDEYRARQRDMESLNLHLHRHLHEQQQQQRMDMYGASPEGVQDMHSRRTPIFAGSGPVMDMQLDPERDPVDKLKEILECQDIPLLIGSFDPSNTKHVRAAYNWIQSCCRKVQERIERLSALSVNPARGFNLNIEPSVEEGEMVFPSSSSTANAGARPRFDLNVVPVANEEIVCATSSSVNRFKGFNLNVPPRNTEDEMIHLEI